MKPHQFSPESPPFQPGVSAPRKAWSLGLPPKEVWFAFGVVMVVDSYNIPNTGKDVAFLNKLCVLLITSGLFLLVSLFK